MSWLWTLIVGAVIGAIAGAITSKGNSMGCVTNIIAGLVGSSIGQAIFGEVALKSCRYGTYSIYFRRSDFGSSCLIFLWKTIISFYKIVN